MSGSLRLTSETSRRGIARQGGAVHLLVQVEPPEPRPSAQRRAVALALVIDRSGSMAQPAIRLETTGAHGIDPETPCKLDYVREAALQMLERMPDGDAVALITFDDQVRVEKPLTVLSNVLAVGSCQRDARDHNGWIHQPRGRTSGRHPATGDRKERVQRQAGAALGWLGQRRREPSRPCWARSQLVQPTMRSRLRRSESGSTTTSD